MKKILVVFALFTVISMCKIFAQKVIISDGYAGVSAEDLCSGSYEDRTNFLPADGRVPRHKYSESSYNQLVSRKFIISPTNIDVNGNATIQTTDRMSWAEASGWNTTANNMDVTLSVATADTGCPMYKGKDGKNEELGKWRLPTQLELYLIFIVNQGLVKTAGTNFTALENLYYYWSSTEASAAYAQALQFKLGNGYAQGRSSSNYVRCIRDL